MVDHLGAQQVDFQAGSNQLLPPEAVAAAAAQAKAKAKTKAKKVSCYLLSRFCFYWFTS